VGTLAHLWGRLLPGHDRKQPAADGPILTPEPAAYDAEVLFAGWVDLPERAHVSRQDESPQHDVAA